MSTDSEIRQAAAVLEAASPAGQRDRANQVVSMARRHADEIRSAAEREAEQMLRDAERKAAALLDEGHDACQRELDRMLALRQEIATCLETAVTALHRARELSIVQTPSNASAPSAKVEPTAVSTVAASAATAPQPAGEATGSLSRTLYRTGLIVWGVLMLSIVLVLSMPTRTTILDKLWFWATGARW